LLWYQLSNGQKWDVGPGIREGKGSLPSLAYWDEGVRCNWWLMRDVIVVKVWWIIWIPCFDEVKTWSSSDEEFPVTQCILKFEGSVHLVVSNIFTWRYFHLWWFQKWRWTWCSFNKVKVKKVKIGIVLLSWYIVRFMIMWYQWRRVWTIEVDYKS